MQRSTLSALVLVAALAVPAVCSARGTDGDDGPAMLQYGFRGFWTGAELGLAVGFLSTGDRYESGEWRKLVLGAGVGALGGVGAGITLGIVDASNASRPRYGWFVLRDMGYGALLGGLTGAAVGALFWVDGGRAKDVLTGLSVGALIGAAAGVVFGVVEGIGAPPRHERADAGGALQLTLVALPTRGRALALGPGVTGRF